jgi:hypothetical protein
MTNASRRQLLLTTALGSCTSLPALAGSCNCRARS